MIILNNNKIASNHIPDYLDKSTMQEMRELNNEDIRRLTNGTYKAVRLNGYYAIGDTPNPILYTVSDTTTTDDGGSVIVIGAVKLKHDFKGNVNVLYFGAKQDKTFNSNTAINNAVKTLRNLGGVLEFSCGEYQLNHLDLFTKAYSNITLKGNGSTIYQTMDRPRYQITPSYNTFARYFGADGVFNFNSNVKNQTNDNESLKNITVHGFNFITDVVGLGFDELTPQISAYGVSNFNVYNCTFKGFLSDGISIAGAWNLNVDPAIRDAYNKDVSIHNCHFDGVNKDNRQCISIYYCDGYKIDFCTFKNSTREDMPAAIDCEADLATVISRRGRISNCSFSNIGGFGAIAYFQRQISNTNFIGLEVDNCYIEKCRSPFTVVGIDGYTGFNQATHNTIFRDCVVNNVTNVCYVLKGFGVLFDNISYKTIQGSLTNSETGCKTVTFKNCSFDTFTSNNGLVFSALSENISFLGCTFKGFNQQFITINDLKGLGRFEGNKYISSNYADAYPIVFPAGTAYTRATYPNFFCKDNNTGAFKDFTTTFYYLTLNSVAPNIGKIHVGKNLNPVNMLDFEHDLEVQGYPIDYTGANVGRLKVEPFINKYNANKCISIRFVPYDLVADTWTTKNISNTQWGVWK